MTPNEYIALLFRVPSALLAHSLLVWAGVGHNSNERQYETRAWWVFGNSLRLFVWLVALNLYHAIEKYLIVRRYRNVLSYIHD